MAERFEKDPAKRIAFWFFPAVKLGGVMALHDIYVRSQCTTALHAIARLGHNIIPMAGIGFTLPAMTIIAEDLRGKRDPVNYFIGGTSCMPIIKKWLNLPPYMVRTGVLLIALSAIIYGMCEDGIPELSDKPIKPLKELVYEI